MLSPVTQFKLTCALTLGFALTGIAQESQTSAVGNIAATTTTSQFVFVPLANYPGSGAMREYRINPSTGALTVVKQAIMTPNFASFTFRDPKQRFLYVDGQPRGSNIASDVIAEYKVNGSTGAITSLPGSAFNLNNEEIAFGVIRPDLKFAYIEDYASASIVHIIAMNPLTGGLVKAVGTVEIPIGKTSDFLLNLRFDPSGRYLYVADGEANMIDAYVSDPTTGNLTEVRGAPFTPRGSTPGGCSPKQNFCGGAVAITGNHLYYVGFSYDGVAEFKIDASTGALTELPSSPAANPAHLGALLRVAPNGKHLYVDAPTGTRSFILGYTINQITGSLTRVSGSPFLVAGPDFYSMDIDQTGNFLYTTTGQSISGFRINSTSGALSKVPGSPYSAPGNTGLTIVH